MGLLNIREMLELSIRDEETGVIFYTALAENAANEELRRTMQTMANQEKQHALRFQNMLDECARFSPRESYSGEYENYLKVLISGRTYIEPAEAARLAREAGSTSAALDMALTMERDALLFYMEIREFVDDDYKKIINAIMDEERNHVFELTQLKQQFS